MHTHRNMNMNMCTQIGKHINHLRISTIRPVHSPHPQPHPHLAIQSYMRACSTSLPCPATFSYTPHHHDRHCSLHTLTHTSLLSCSFSKRLYPIPLRYYSRASKKRRDDEKQYQQDANNKDQPSTTTHQHTSIPTSQSSSSKVDIYEVNIQDDIHQSTLPHHDMDMDYDYEDDLYNNSGMKKNRVKPKSKLPDESILLNAMRHEHSQIYKSSGASHITTADPIESNMKRQYIAMQQRESTGMSELQDYIDAENDIIENPNEFMGIRMDAKPMKQPYNSYIPAVRYQQYVDEIGKNVYRVVKNEGTEDGEQGDEYVLESEYDGKHAYCILQCMVDRIAVINSTQIISHITSKLNDMNCTILSSRCNEYRSYTWCMMLKMAIPIDMNLQDLQRDVRNSLVELSSSPSSSAAASTSSRSNCSVRVKYTTLGNTTLPLDAAALNLRVYAPQHRSLFSSLLTILRDASIHIIDMNISTVKNMNMKYSVIECMCMMPSSAEMRPKEVVLRMREFKKIYNAYVKFDIINAPDEEDKEQMNPSEIANGSGNGHGVLNEQQTADHSDHDESSTRPSKPRIVHMPPVSKRRSKPAKIGNLAS